MKVILTGGLGNQIFQLNAALEMYPGEIKLISNIGKPRLDLNGNPEILGLRLPNRVTVINPKVRNLELASKVFGLNLRAHFAPSALERYFLRIFRFLGSLYFSMIFREFTVICVSTDVGFSKVRRLKEHDLLIGYFQSYRYLTPKTKAEMSALIPVAPTAEYLKIRERLTGFNILVIHVRLGDYFHEPQIGILKREYYEAALAEIELSKVDKVLVFSDSPERVSDYLPPIPDTNVEIVKNSLSSVETISLMSIGTQFIISNSTFSWWAAAMSTNTDNLVIAPSPWFEKMSSPRDLISPAWHSVER